MTNTETIELLKVLRGLPPQKIDEVKDFVLFLRDRYGDVDYSDEWSDEDVEEFAAASRLYFENSVGDESTL